MFCQMIVSFFLWYQLVNIVFMFPPSPLSSFLPYLIILISTFYKMMLIISIVTDHFHLYALFAVIFWSPTPELPTVHCYFWLTTRWKVKRKTRFDGKIAVGMIETRKRVVSSSIFLFFKWCCAMSATRSMMPMETIIAVMLDLSQIFTSLIFFFDWD